MKVSDILLDLATGDASMTDAYIQEACGKIEVSKAVFDAAYKISELPKGDFLVIQEAADAGLPTDQAGAAKLACESIQQGMVGFYELLVETAKKSKAASVKDMKLVVALGKKFGITNDPDNFSTAFATPLGKAIIDEAGGKIKIDDKRFLKGRFANKIAMSYVKGVSQLLLAYGINITDVFSDPVIAAEVAKKASVKGEAPTTLKDVNGYLSDGGKLIKIEKIADKDSHYTDSITASDITDLINSLYVVIATSDAVIKLAGNKTAKKDATSTIADLCAKETGTEKKVAKTVVSISDEITKWKDNVEAITSAITKTYADSIYSLYEAISKDKSTGVE